MIEQLEKVIKREIDILKHRKEVKAEHFIMGLNDAYRVLCWAMRQGKSIWIELERNRVKEHSFFRNKKYYFYGYDAICRLVEKF